MPTYNLLCKECDHEFEFVRKMSEPNPPCEECGANMVITLVKSAPLTVMKGSGWASKEIKDDRAGENQLAR